MISPLDIENKRFTRQTIKGYNTDEVDEFLDDLTADYEKIYKENKENKKLLEKLQRDLEHYKNIEATLKDTLVMAQSTAEEVKNVAKQQADQIINEAKANAEKEAMSLENSINLKKKELEDINKQFEVYKAKMESLLISQLELLKEINRD